MDIYSVYYLKINSNCEKQVIILMIPNEKKEGWYYLAIKKIISIIKKINVKMPCCFLLFELSSFFSNKKQT